MKHITLTLITLTTTLFANEQKWLTTERLGIGVQAGTQGIGPVLTYDIYDWLYLKAEGNFFSYELDDTEVDEITYSGDLDLFSVGLSVTARPFYKAPIIDGFKISAGLFAVNNSLSLRAEGSGQEVDINDTTVTLGQGDAVTGEADFNTIAPYLGIGWDWMLGSEDQFTISLEAGAFFTGAPDTEFDVEDNSGLGISEADLQAERENFEEELDAINIYPVVRLGLLYRF